MVQGEENERMIKAKIQRIKAQNEMSLKDKLFTGLMILICIGIVRAINSYLPNWGLIGVGGWFNPLHITMQR